MLLSAGKVLRSLLESYYGPPIDCEECENKTTYLVRVENGIGEWRCFTLGCEQVSHEYDME